MTRRPTISVMPDLVSGIHVFFFLQGVAGRDKPGHDELGVRLLEALRC
jgi:hypothetical protein